MKVSFSKIKITPKEYIGVPMAGYTRKDPCLGKLDDIHANGVLIESSSLKNGKENLLLISLDLLKVPLVWANYVRKKINDEFNSLDTKNILIHATHTHSAPDLTGEFHWPGGFFSVIKGIMFGANRNDRYLVWLACQTVKMVKELFNSLTPCKIAWAKKSYNPDIVINRRHPKRKATPDLGVITFRELESNKLIGFIINYACHPTTLSHANNKMSADYPGRIASKIDEITNNKIKSVYFNGPAGDLNPITTCGTDYQKLELDKSLVYDQLGTYEHTKKFGFEIAQAALKLAESIPSEKYLENLEFKSYLKDFSVPLKDHKYFSKTWFRNKIIYLFKKYFIISISMHTEANFPAFVIKHRALKINVNSILQYIKVKGFSKSDLNLKEFSIIAVPGELFEEIGKNLFKKSSTGKENTFIFQNSNDWIAYLFPLKEYVEVGGYEPIASFGPLCGDVVEKEMLVLIEKIK